MIGAKIARRYAKALLGIGQEEGQYEEYGKNLKEFADFCLANEEFYRIIASKIFSLEDRRKVLEAVLGKSGFMDTVKNFLRLLLDKGRIGAIQEITEYYAILTDEISGIARADIITARPLKTETLAKIEEVLTNLTAKKVKSSVKEDDSLIGGVVVKIGDLVLDGSVKAQIEGLKETMRRGE
ncbi:MAG: ATP synthase F1 subunit delta [Deltaproteobacteria bacterium]|nr:ATP synthase F1 subunit delta [Deltaproteobacteria bacterium]